MTISTPPKLARWTMRYTAKTTTEFAKLVAVGKRAKGNKKLKKRDSYVIGGRHLRNVLVVDVVTNPEQQTILITYLEG